jgi:hypothetical protein
MTWRTALGLRPTPTDLAQDLLKAAERHGLAGWQLFFVGRAVQRRTRRLIRRTSRASERYLRFSPKSRLQGTHLFAGSGQACATELVA